MLGITKALADYVSFTSTYVSSDASHLTDSPLLALCVMLWLSLLRPAFDIDNFLMHTAIHIVKKCCKLLKAVI